uniref:Mediator of RNA polymerase II transcription subunit 17 n=1 Tax=Panagrolaimus sp. PS1159 TaxID=55785 RepID=A0AC35G0Q1_9BILA
MDRMEYSPGDSTNGVKLNLGPIIENRIIEYQYDGTEKHARDYDLDEITADLACRIDWRTILGPDDTIEPLYNLRNLEINNRHDDDRKTAAQKEREHNEKIADAFPPEAGPWASVAKSLHESLESANNLLDVLRVIKDGNGLVMATVAAQPEDPPGLVNQSKAFTWNANRKALTEAKKVFDNYLENHKENSEIELFFKELKEIRKSYLVRKMGDHLIGDLGYRVYGSKWIPSETFDIYRVEENRRSGGLRFNNRRIPTMMEVDVPKHLAVRTSICVTVVFDNEGYDLLQKNVIEIKKPAANGTATTLEGNDEIAPQKGDKKHDDLELEELESYGEKPNLSRMAYWKNALRWARDTLVYRDLFNQLTRECASLIGRSCSIRDDIIIISLFDDVMLKIEKSDSPFVDGELSVECDTYLMSMLKFCFYEEVNKSPYRSSYFVSLPNSTATDISELQGPYSMTLEDIIARDQPPKMLVERMISVTSHYCLVRCALDILTKHQTTHTDPTTTWKWQRCTITNSALQVSLSCRGYEYIPKNSFHLRITEENIELIAKDGHVIDCRRDVKMVMENLLYQSALFWISATNLVANRAGFHLLQSHMNEFDINYKPAPTILLLNTCSTRMIFIQFFINGSPPMISTREILDFDPLGNQTEAEMDRRQFTELKYDRIPGSTFLKKIDNVFAVLRH